MDTSARARGVIYGCNEIRKAQILTCQVLLAALGQKRVVLKWLLRQLNNRYRLPGMFSDKHAAQPRYSRTHSKQASKAVVKLHAVL